jgi:hypothetical protein
LLVEIRITIQELTHIDFLCMCVTFYINSS